MRDNLGRFVPGSSGNPKGRQSKDRETKYLSVAQRVSGFREWREIVLVAVDQAKEGGCASKALVVGVPDRQTSTNKGYRWG